MSTYSLLEVKDIDRRTVAAIGLGDPRTPTVDLIVTPAMGGHWRIALMPGSAKRIVSFLGAFIHNGWPEAIEVRSACRPSDKIELVLGATPDHADKPRWVYVGGSGNVGGTREPSPWLMRAQATELWDWLVEWCARDTPHRRPIGAHTNERDYQEQLRHETAWMREDE